MIFVVRRIAPGAHLSLWSATLKTPGSEPMKRGSPEVQNFHQNSCNPNKVRAQSKDRKQDARETNTRTHCDLPAYNRSNQRRRPAGCFERATARFMKKQVPVTNQNIALPSTVDSTPQGPHRLKDKPKRYRLIRKRLQGLRFGISKVCWMLVPPAGSNVSASATTSPRSY